MAAALKPNRSVLPSGHHFATARSALATVSLLALLWATPTLAQETEKEPAESNDAADKEAPAEHAPLADSALRESAAGEPSEPVNEDRIIEFAADTLTYDENEDVIEADGTVIIERQGNRLLADHVTWNRTTGRVFAAGGVRIVSPDGDVIYGEDVELSESLRDGVIENLLIVMNDGVRLAARRGVAEDGYITLDQAAYTSCSLRPEEGCPREPSWELKAAKVYYDPDKKRISYDQAYIELFGLPLVPLPPFFSQSVGREAQTGVLAPTVGYSGLGVELGLPYYWRIAENRHLKLTGNLYSKVAPMVNANYRALVSNGAYEIDLYGTYGRRVDISDPQINSERDTRGFLSAGGELQLNRNWSVDSTIQLTTDRTFADRYDITNDDRLRSTLAAQRIDDDSFFEVRGWHVQTLRLGDPQDETPIALPIIDFRYRVPDPVAGGRLSLQANSLSILRRDGQDTQRAFVSSTWQQRTILPTGQRLAFTLFGRGDIYHSDENDETDAALYRGSQGWETRGIAAAAADLEWPFVGQAFGGTQLLIPRVQIVASPKLKNLDVPNEDARAVDLEDSNLFALNRFPGYDRFEDNVRITYGLDWHLRRRDFTVSANVGQSYRLSKRGSIFPDGTGLSDRLSDVVGRVEIRWLDSFALASRFRLDKDNAKLRRLEVDATVGSRKTYAKFGYLQLNRNISGLEDLSDREELRAAGRVQISRFWSIFGSAIIDLTDRREDPTATTDGFEPIRSRVGITYEDPSLRLGFVWKRKYEKRGDAGRDDKFAFTLSFRNLGG